MQANPCKVHSVIDIDFGGKRTPEIRKTAKYTKFVQQIEDIMDSIK
jgi:hypothetical protein